MGHPEADYENHFSILYFLEMYKYRFGKNRFGFGSTIHKSTFQHETLP